MDDSKRRVKKAIFPEEVLSVKKMLRKTNDPRFETMCLLTETRSDELYVDDLKRMWSRLSEYSGGFGAGNNDLWVHGFLNITHKLKQLPEHFYMREEDRKDLIERLTLSTRELVSIHKAYDFSIKNLGDVSFIESLEFMAQQTIQELKETVLEGKAGKNVHAIRFIRILAQHNRMMFGETLNSVLKTATLAIYEIEYSDSGISNLLNRS